MSKKRQTAIAILDCRGNPRVQLKTLCYDYVDNHKIPNHYHNEHQLVFASSGVMTVQTKDGAWVVPPLKGVWIPSKKIHSIAMSGKVLMRTLYFSPRFLRKMTEKCVVLNVSPILRELVLHACTKSEWCSKLKPDLHIIGLIVDLIKNSNKVPLQLPYPQDIRANRIVKILINDPSNSKTLDELCKNIGGSRRTIERVFVKETGMTFGKWRHHVRLHHSVRLLASGEKVSTAALEVGYSNPSAFISAFKKSFGQTPIKYMS